MEALRCLPGVGPKSAQRMAFHLLQRDRKGGLQLAEALGQAMTEIGHCSECRTFTEEDVCHICTNLNVRKMVKYVWLKALQTSQQSRRQVSTLVVTSF